MQLVSSVTYRQNQMANVYFAHLTQLDYNHAVKILNSPHKSISRFRSHDRHLINAQFAGLRHFSSDVFYWYIEDLGGLAWIQWLIYTQHKNKCWVCPYEPLKTATNKTIWELYFFIALRILKYQQAISECNWKHCSSAAVHSRWLYQMCINWRATQLSEDRKILTATCHAGEKPLYLISAQAQCQCTIWRCHMK